MTSKYFTCKSCHENTSYKTGATDRVELEREVGNKISTQCSHCHDLSTITVNDVRAEPNLTMTWLGVAAGIILTIALWNLGFIAGLSLALPLIIYNTQRKSAETFNSYRVRV